MESIPSTLDTDQAPKTNRTMIIGIASAVVLLCCCIIVAAVAIFGFVIPTGSDVSPVPTEVEFIPPVDNNPVPQPNFGVPDLDSPPAGGLGNDILKQDTWNTLVPVAIGFGCDRPVSSDSTIEVLQEPTSNGPGGVWKEKWTVVCESGEKYPFEVEFILDATGATFDITPLQ